MPEPVRSAGQNPRRYKWPWIALCLLLLGIALAVLWVALAAMKIEHQRDFGEPLPSTAPAR
jgi:hypothetical protein